MDEFQIILLIVLQEFQTSSFFQLLNFKIASDTYYLGT
jgi:hypothetical protein